MENKLAKLIELVKKLPEACLDETLAYVGEKIEEYAEEKPIKPCPHCKSENVHRYGQVSERQRYRCKDCGKSFMETTNTVMAHSHCGEAAWKQVIRDTVERVPLDETAAALELSHSTAFNMRHKILLALEAEEARNPTVLSGVCELDDTYVLECYKGKKLPADFWRKPRKHGATAQKRGVSNEYICISTGIQRDGGAYSQTVTRSTPGKDDLIAVFEGHIDKSALILCDGASSYNALGESCGCAVMNVNEDGGFFNNNTANGLHSFIKQRYNQYRGVATKYLNRYNVLLSNAYRNNSGLVDRIYNLLRSNDAQRHHSVNDVITLNLLGL